MPNKNDKPEFGKKPPEGFTPPKGKMPGGFPPPPPGKGKKPPKGGFPFFDDEEEQDPTVPKKKSYIRDDPLKRRGRGRGGPGHGPPMGFGGEKLSLKEIDFKAAMRIFTFYSTGDKLLLLLIVACIFINSQVTVQSAVFLGSVIDGFIKPNVGVANPDFSVLKGMITRMAFIYAAGIAASLTQNLVMIRISQGTLKRIRDTLFSKMQDLPIRYFDNNSYGDIMSFYTNDVDTLQGFISRLIPQILSSTFTIVSVFITMVKLNIPLTAFVIITAFLIMFSTKNIAIKASRSFSRRQRDLGELNGFIEEFVEGQKVVKVFCHEEAAKTEFSELNQNLFNSSNTASKFTNYLMPLMRGLSNVQYILLAVVGGGIACLFPATISLGMISKFLNLSRNFTHSVDMITEQASSVVSAIAGASRVFTLMDETPEEDNGYVTLVNARYTKDGELVETHERTGTWAWKEPDGNGGFKFTELRGHVIFTDVNFGYIKEKQVLFNISMFAKPGQKLAFVGATGAGKTTITNLLNRFYDIDSGTITYDGIDIQNIKKADLRRSLGIILQDVSLFTDTIMENLRYGNLEATDEECIAAAKLCNAHDFIMLLPDGYNTELSGDGGGLSQGQRQLLSIARAAVADPPVMIMDEATSSIDTRTERIIQDGMDSLMNGRTVFVIAHRLSTIQNSNAIMVLEHGRIIERGNHEELLALKGTYNQLYTGSFAEEE